jgi:hypothetical protein
MPCKRGNKACAALQREAKKRGEILPDLVHQLPDLAVLQDPLYVHAEDPDLESDARSDTTSTPADMSTVSMRLTKEEIVSPRTGVLIQEDQLTFKALSQAK